jgi:hypothetical protein
MDVTSTKNLSIGQEERTQPITDHAIGLILDGRLTPPQGVVKGLARQVQVLRERLGITVDRDGEHKSE